MKNLYKTILAGMTAFWAACSNESSVDQSVAGATTEPSTSPTAELTAEQKAILAKAFYTIVDSSKVDSLKELFGSQITGIHGINRNYFNTNPWSVTNDQVFTYPSKDGRKVCDVVTYTQEDKKDLNGVLKAMSYDEHYHECDIDEYCLSDYLSTHQREVLDNTKIIDVDGTPVVMRTVDSGSRTFWGYGVSCGEYLNKFKQYCISSNGLFLDLSDACNMNQLDLVCVSFIPEGKTSEDVLNSFTEGYKNQCLEDSIRYAPYDDENYVYSRPSSDSLSRVYELNEKWDKTQKHSMNAYRWQFSIIDSTISIDGNDIFFEERDDSELNLKHANSLGFAYNTLPNTKIADTYRKEGVYILPDSLVASFFPTLATYPTGLDGLKWYPPEIFYLIVIKDVGAKGHLVTDFDENGIYVTDIVKSGNCPEDTSVHYSMILLADSPDWDVLERPIVKTTYVSDNWNCDNPETLEKIEPYGEWTFSNIYRFSTWFMYFEKDRYLEMYGGKDKLIEDLGEDFYQELYGNDQSIFLETIKKFYFWGV